MKHAFGLYIHWPFCLSKCPYCDFNSHVREKIDEARWAEALAREIAHYAARTPGRAVTSVFFGGGTPSLMAGETVARVLDAVRAHWPIAPEAEITLESNPSSAEAEKFARYREAGINRLSLGVQSLDATALKFLGRRHDAAQALAALAMAKAVFPRYSFDLIYARPQHDLGAWRTELEAALELAGDHLSLYQLTIEPGTQFEQALARGDFTMLDEAQAAALHEATLAQLSAAGFEDYEISNFARAGGHSRHNLVYWRYQDYVGVGPGAHGRVHVEGRHLATRQHRAPEAWLAMVEDRGHATRTQEEIEPRAAFEEMMMMGLRLKEGVELAHIERVTGRALSGWIETQRLQALIEGGFLSLDQKTIRASPQGRRVLDSLLPRLLA